MPPLVTVVTPCYNAERFIASTLASVQRQTLPDWEHIVVDDGSTDASAHIVEKALAEDKSGRLRLLRQSNQGVSQARNAGFDARSSDSNYVLFLDADDCLKPKMLETLVAHMETHPEVGLTYCLFDHLDENGTASPVQTVPRRYRSSRLGLHAVPDDVLATPVLSIFSGQAIPSVSLIRVSCFEATAGFDGQLGQPEEDVDVFTQIALEHPVHRLPLRLVYYRRYAAQTTRDTARLERQRKKLLAKWSRPFNDLTRTHRHTCDVLRFDWNGKVVPLMWLQAARAIRTDGQVLRPMLLLMGSLSRYLYYTGLSLLRPRSSP